MKALTLSEVLNYWHESIIGTAKNIRPKGYERCGEHVDQEAELRQRCAEFVDGWIAPSLRKGLMRHIQNGWVSSEIQLIVNMIEAALNMNPIYRCQEPNRPMRSAPPTYSVTELTLRLRKDQVSTSTWTLKKLFEISTYNGNVWKDDRGRYVISELGIEAIKADVASGARAKMRTV